MATFTPRTTPPTATDKWWIHTSHGGKNSCIHISNGSVLPNCVGYAWGRFCEILGDVCKLSRADAGKWYGYTADGYNRGSKPQVGAVMCWSRPGHAGHVCIVEKVYPDGSVDTSESAYNGTRWYKSHRVPPNYDTGGYIFQGFIYNPAVEGLKDLLTQFLSTAYSHVGEDNSWTVSRTGISHNSPWSSPFILACAKAVDGVVNVALPNTTTVTGIAKIGVSTGLGKWIDGPIHSNVITPQIGDVVLFRNHSASLYTHKYQADRCGIVYSVSGDTITIIEGDYGSRVAINKYKISSPMISGYYRPGWERTHSSVLNQLGYFLSPLYEYESSRNDAIIREVGYLNSQYKPSIQSSHIKLSVINYTGLLGDLYDTFAAALRNGSNSYSSSSVVNVDNVGNTSVKAAVQFLMENGLNAAASCGVVANIYHESGFNTAAVGDNGTSFGLCQWHLSRGDRMKQMAGADWATDLTGQLNYLWYELNHSYTSVLAQLRAVPNSLSGARQAADVFVRRFEIPANVDNESLKRQDTAESYWSKLIIQQI